jgi:hypothetical protein
MVNEDLNNVNRIFRYWNNQDIITHRQLTDGIKKAIQKALKDYSIGDIQKAIYNYGIILKGDEYWFKYKWTLQEFLSRHNGNNIERFLDLEAAKSNYKRGSKINATENQQRRTFESL